MYVCVDPLCQAIELDWNILVVLVPQRASVCVLFYLINRKYKFRAKKRTFRACCICKCSAFCMQWVINKIVVGFSDRCCCKIYRCRQRKKKRIENYVRQIAFIRLADGELYWYGEFPRTIYTPNFANYFARSRSLTPALHSFYSLHLIISIV